MESELDLKWLIIVLCVLLLRLENKAVAHLSYQLELKQKSSLCAFCKTVNTAVFFFCCFVLGNIGVFVKLWKNLWRLKRDVSRSKEEVQGLVVSKPQQTTRKCLPKEKQMCGKSQKSQKPARAPRCSTPRNAAFQRFPAAGGQQTSISWLANKNPTQKQKRVRSAQPRFSLDSSFGMFDSVGC